MAARRSWVTLATLAVVAASAAAGVVTWDARVRPLPAAEPVPAWSASLSSPADPVPSAIAAGDAAARGHRRRRPDRGRAGDGHGQPRGGGQPALARRQDRGLRGRHRSQELVPAGGSGRRRPGLAGPAAARPGRPAPHRPRPGRGAAAGGLPSRRGAHADLRPDLLPAARRHPARVRRIRWQLRTGVAFYPSDLGLGPERAFNASAVGERDGLVLLLAPRPLPARGRRQDGRGRGRAALRAPRPGVRVAAGRHRRDDGLPDVVRRGGLPAQNWMSASPVSWSNTKLRKKPKNTKLSSRIT